MTLDVHCVCVLLLLFLGRIVESVGLHRHFQRARKSPTPIVAEQGRELKLICNSAWYGGVSWVVYTGSQARVVSTCKAGVCENYESKDYVARCKSMPVSLFLTLYEVDFTVLNTQLSLTKVECHLLKNIIWDSWNLSIYGRALEFSANNQSSKLALNPGADVMFRCRSLKKLESKLIMYRNTVLEVLNVTDSQSDLMHRMSNLLCGTQFHAVCQAEHDAAHGRTIPILVAPCKADYLNFTANGENHQLYTNAGSDVMLTCTSEGEPGSNLTLYTDRMDHVLNTTTHPNQLTYMMSDFSCGRSMHLYCALDDARALTSIKITVKACQDKNIAFMADMKREHLDVYPDSLVVFTCDTDLGQGSEFILYNNTLSNELFRTKESLRFTVSNFTPGSSFRIGCQVDNKVLSTYSEILVRVKQSKANCCVGIIVSATAAPCLFLLGLTLYFITKHRQRKFVKIPGRVSFTHRSQVVDKTFEPPVFGDKYSHLKLPLNFDKNTDCDLPPPPYSEIDKYCTISNK